MSPPAVRGLVTVSRADNQSCITSAIAVIVVQFLLVAGMTHRLSHLTLILLVGLAFASSAFAEAPTPSFRHHLRATPDVLATVYATTSATLNLLYGYVTSSDANGNVVLERHFGYASAAGAALWAIGNAQSVIRSYLDPSNELALRRVERVFICSGIAALGLYTLSPQYDGDEARGIAVTLLLPMVVDLAVTFIPYPN